MGMLEEQRTADIIEHPDALLKVSPDQNAAIVPNKTPSSIDDLIATCPTPSAVEEVLLSIEKRLHETGFVHVPGRLMRQLLIHHGATEDVLQKMEEGKIHDRMARDVLPSMTHRTLEACRMVFKENSTTRDILDESNCVTPMVSQVPAHEIASDRGAALHDDRSSTRYYSIAQRFGATSVPRSKSKIMNNFIPFVHESQCNLMADHPLTMHDQLLVRITREPYMDDRYGPTPEGVHQDNTQVSAIMMVGRHGVESGGETRIWKTEMPTGYYQDEEFDKFESQGLLLFNHALKDPWETIIFEDRRVKHEARAFRCNKTCWRDVVVNFLRKPLSDGMDMVKMGGAIRNVTQYY